MSSAVGQRSSDMLCKFYDVGKCMNGRDCKFRHGSNDRRPLIVAGLRTVPASTKISCRYYTQGQCSLGISCPYAHSTYEVDEALRRKSAHAASQASRAPSRTIGAPIFKISDYARNNDSEINNLSQNLTNLTMLSKPKHKPSIEFNEVEWEFPSDNDSYFYGAAGTFDANSGDQRQVAWSHIALNNVPETVLLAEAKADEMSHTRYLQYKEASKVTPITIPPREICQYHLEGTCRYGGACRHAHICTSTESETIKENDISAAMPSECGICFELVQGKFGILTGCSHSFCLECIRNWRQTGLQNQTAKSVRMCPLCRETSYFIVPSTKHITDPHEKLELIEKYKSNLSTKPCSYFSKDQICPFGSSCFYAHIDKNGVRANVPHLRVRMGEACTKEIQGDIQLFNFFG